MPELRQPFPSAAAWQGVNSRRRGKMGRMGFYLWLDEQLAWAQGTYEYRPMGAAVISKSDLFRRRDFSARRPPRPPRTARFAGQFASLGHVNQHLQNARKR